MCPDFILAAAERVELRTSSSGGHLALPSATVGRRAILMRVRRRLVQKGQEAEIVSIWVGTVRVSGRHGTIR